MWHNHISPLTVREESNLWTSLIKHPEGGRQGGRQEGGRQPERRNITRIMHMYELISQDTTTRNKQKLYCLSYICTWTSRKAKKWQLLQPKFSRAKLPCSRVDGRKAIPLQTLYSFFPIRFSCNASPSCYWDIQQPLPHPKVKKCDYKMYISTELTQTLTWTAIRHWKYLEIINVG